jgi:hypothetical protein
VASFGPTARELAKRRDAPVDLNALANGSISAWRMRRRFADISHASDVCGSLEGSEEVNCVRCLRKLGTDAIAVCVSDDNLELRKR